MNKDIKMKCVPPNARHMKMHIAENAWAKAKGVTQFFGIWD